MKSARCVSAVALIVSLVVAAGSANAALRHPGVVRAGQSAPAPDPSDTRAPSSTSVSAAREKRTILASGSVSPQHTGIAMTVKLMKRVSGHYKAIQIKHPVLDADSNYSTSFKRPRGICEVKARFPGDEDHLP